MFCLRDSTSWCDSADYGYLYLSRNVMDEYFPTVGIMYFWAFRVAEDCIGIYQERFSLPFIHYSTDVPRLILFMVLPMAIGIFSCLTRSGIITRMDPAEAYGGAAPTESADPPRWLQKLRVSEMNKIAILSVYRNKRRLAPAAAVKPPL